MTKNINLIRSTTLIKSLSGEDILANRSGTLAWTANPLS